MKIAFYFQSDDRFKVKHSILRTRFGLRIDKLLIRRHNNRPKNLPLKFQLVNFNRLEFQLLDTSGERVARSGWYLIVLLFISLFRHFLDNFCYRTSTGNHIRSWQKKMIPFSFHRRWKTETVNFNNWNYVRECENSRYDIRRNLRNDSL